jgi:hypothetical protein
LGWKSAVRDSGEEVSTRDYEIVVRRDSTIPEGRARALKRMTAILAHFPNGVPDRANCFFCLFQILSGLRWFGRQSSAA